MSRIRRSALFSLLSPSGARNLRAVLRQESTGGVLLLIATALALLWANSPLRERYSELREVHLGPAALHLDLSVHAWAADGLLAIFFFVVGLELKREIVAGELRRPATAIVPIVAAVGGMVVPAAIYLAVNLTAGDGAPRGWAVPTATDIAFAVAVLAVVGRGLPSALRAFLLTLAVVDDLLAIIVIAVFYTETVAFGWLAASLAVVALFGFLLRRGVRSPWLLVPLGVTAWALMHASGIHATIAGVLLGLTVPAIARRGARQSLAEHYEHRWRPVSAGFAVPVFALLSAGVTVSGGAVGDALADPAARAVVLALVLGKPIGIVGATALVSLTGRAGLAKGVSWWDVIGVGALGGIGFTVSLLVADLAFGAGTAQDASVKVAVLSASLIAALAGAGILLARGRRYRASAAERLVVEEAERELAGSQLAGSELAGSQLAESERLVVEEAERELAESERATREPALVGIAGGHVLRA
jgi:NhaA family Na+:H+ antiporter